MLRVCAAVPVRVSFSYVELSSAALALSGRRRAAAAAMDGKCQNMCIVEYYRNVLVRSDNYLIIYLH